MKESGYYPVGTEYSPDSPWNEQKPELKTFDVCISQTLSRNTTVTTNDYLIDVDKDESGCYEVVDTTDTDWKGAYDTERMTPLELITEFKAFIEESLKDLERSTPKYKKMRYLLDECEGWVEDELVIVEN